MYLKFFFLNIWLTKRKTIVNKYDNPALDYFHKIAYKISFLRFCIFLNFKNKSFFFIRLKIYNCPES